METRRPLPRPAGLRGWLGRTLHGTHVLPGVPKPSLQHVPCPSSLRQEAFFGVRQDEGVGKPFSLPQLKIKVSALGNGHSNGPHESWVQALDGGMADRAQPALHMPAR